MVELEDDKGVPKLVTYGFTEQSVDIVKDDSESAKNEIVKILKKLTKESGVTTSKAITALPTFSVFSSVISLPQMSKKDLMSAVKWEAKKIIPMPIEEIILDWYVLGDEPKDDFSSKFKNIFSKKKIGGENLSQKQEPSKNIDQNQNKKVLEEGTACTNDIKILLTGAPKNLIVKYIDIFQKAGFNLLSLETEIFALIRSLVGNDKSTLMVVDIGAMSTNISLVQNGIAIVNRGIGLGGKSISEEISHNLDVSFERAEQFKFDVGMNSGEGSESSVFKTVEKTITPIVDEIKYTIDFFKNQLSCLDGGKEEKIEKIILTGGGALLNYLPEYLQSQLGRKVYVGDPWARVIYPQDLKPVFQEIGPKLSVPVGLAMREIIS